LQFSLQVASPETFGYTLVCQAIGFALLGLLSELNGRKGE